MSNIYNKKYYKDQGKRFGDENFDIFNIYFKKYKFPGKILDFGSGVGLFFDCATKNFGYDKRDLYAFEINSYANDKLLSKGYNLYKFDTDSKDMNQFSTIFCYQVLEHINRGDVIRILKKCYELLEKGGRMYIYCPIDYAREIDYDPTHINFMNYHWLINYVKKLGFKITKNNGNSLLFHKYAMNNLLVYIISNFIYRVCKYKPSSIELIIEK